MGDSSRTNEDAPPHIVPLSTQVIALFKQLLPITGHYPYIFIGLNDRKKPISKETVNQVIELLVIKAVRRVTDLDIPCQRYCMSRAMIVHGLSYNWLTLIRTVFVVLTIMRSILKSEERCCSGMLISF